MDLSEAVSSRQMCQTFRDKAANERTTRDYFQKFRSGDLSICGECGSGRPQALNEEVLQTAVEKDSNLTCGELLR